MNRREKRRLGKKGRDGNLTLRCGVNATPGQVHLQFSIKTDRLMWSPEDARTVAGYLVKQAEAAEAMASNVAVEIAARKEAVAA